MDYASETERINDVIRQYQDAPTEQFSEAVAENQTQLDATWKQKADEYAHKYSALAEGGGEDLAGALGLEGMYRGYNKIKGLYKEYKDARDKINDNLTKLRNPANKDKIQDPDNPENRPTEEDPEPSQAPQESTEPSAEPTAEPSAEPSAEPTAEPLEEDEEDVEQLNRLFQQSEDIESETQQLRQQKILPDEEPLREGDNLTTDELEQNLRDAGFNEDQISNIRGNVENPTEQPTELVGEESSVNPNLDYLRSNVETGIRTQETDTVFNVGETVSSKEGWVGQARTNNVPLRASEEEMDSSLNNFETSTPRSLYSETRIFAPQNQQPTTDIQMSDFTSEDFVNPNEPPQAPPQAPETTTPPETQLPSGENPLSSSDLTDATTDVRNVLGDTSEPASYLSNVEAGDSFLGNLASRGLSRVGSSLAERGAGIRGAIQNVADRITQPATETLSEDALGDLAKSTAENLASKIAPEGVEGALGLGDVALGAVPVLGEVALGITGLVSVGEGIYHLFHHDAGSPPTAPTPTNVAMPSPSNALTSKFTQGLPSIDGASEMAGSMVSF